MMPDRIMWHLGDEAFEMGSSEISQFKASLIRAKMDYHATIGHAPSHLVLGKIEYAKLCAVVEMMRQSGEIGFYATEHALVTAWQGMILLKSDKDELILAAEIIEKI
jgi:hypothetical protein